MSINQLEEYRKKLEQLSEKEKELRIIYLQKLQQGKIQGPLTGFPSLDNPWLKKPKYEINMPSPDTTAYNFLFECNKNNLDDVALIYDPILEEEPTNITYRELFERIDETARAYIALGIRKGDIVTVSLPSFVENIVNFYALNKIGAVANQIHPLASQDEIEFYLEEAKSKIFVGYGDVYEKIKKIKNDRLQYVILVSPSDSISTKNKINIAKHAIQKQGLAGLKKLTNKDDIEKNSICITWKEFIKAGKKYHKEHNQVSKKIYETLTDIKSFNDKDIQKYINKDSKSLATLTHTSGTTGKSKGVMTDSKAFNSSVIQILQETNLFQRYDKELLILPPFPLYILNNVVHLSLCVGEELVVIPKVEYDKLSLYFKKHHPQHVKGIPSTPESILKDKGFDDYDMSDFKFLISGGGKLQCESAINKFLKDHNCKYSIANGYGMSEGGGAVTCMFDSTIEKGTVGRPLIGSSAKALDIETGDELNYFDSKDGEIMLTGPAIMQGYYQNKEATDSIFYKEKDGTIWLKTGDLGRITEEGNVKLVGRLKRMTFVFDSENNNASKVSHDYMETILCKNEKVEDAIVVAVHDDVSQHAFKAYISLKDKTYDEIIEELDKLCKVTFRKYISPVEYIIVDKIPKTAAGKNDYRYLEAYEKDPEVKKESKVKVLYNKRISER